MFLKRNPVSVNMVTPIILFELKKQQDEGKVIPIEESWMLLNETQAVYLHIHSDGKDSYYEQIKETIETLLNKYELSFVLNRSKIKEYIDNFVSEKDFKKIVTNIKDEVENKKITEEHYEIPENLKFKNIAEKQLISQIFNKDNY